MNILLVDDNLNVLESLQRRIDYKSLGIDKVFAAKSSEQAKDILLKVPIQIMLTDIEMPGGSGIELLEWVNTNGMNIVTMFCTSYADFNYAQKAVELHSFDYYLKPIAFDDLTLRLKKAVVRAQELDKNQKYYKYGQYWLDNQKNIKDSFWRRLLYSVLIPEPEEIAEIVSQQQMDYRQGNLFDVYLFSFSDMSGPFFGMSVTMREFIFKNICDEIFGERGLSIECTLWYQEDMAAIVTYSQNSREEITRIAELIIEAGRRHLKCHVSIFCARKREMTQVRGGIERLECIFRETMISQDVLIFEDEYCKEGFLFHSAKMQPWETLLNSGNFPALEAELDKYLYTLEKEKKLSAQFLKILELDFMQMIYAMLNRKQIEAHRIFYTDDYDYLKSRCTKSRDSFMRYIRYVFSTVAAALKAVEKSETVIDKLLHYIEEHYNEDITRDNLAGIVFLNSDYMSRLFKKETGQSVNDYLLKTRMKKAEELLRLSDRSINSISQDVGYDNFSYFSRIFKRHSGMSPKEYRSRHSER